MKTSLITSVSSVMLLVGAGPALAQSPEDETGTKRLETVTVSAQKRDQSLQDVPIAISAVSASDIERVQAADMQDLQFSTPNLTIQGQDPASMSFGIRGIADRSRNPGYENRIGVYIDGVWIGRSAGANALTLDVENLEILRGPQGTLFGKNTVSGAINITTRKPDDEFGAFVRGQAGNYNLYSLAAGVDVPLADTVRSKLTVSHRSRDGFTDDVNTGDDYGNVDEYAARAGLDWDVTPNTLASLSLDFSENTFRNAIGERTNDPNAPGPYTVALSTVSESYTRSQGVSLNVEHELENGFELTSITGLRSTTRKGTDTDEDYSPAEIAVTDVIQQTAENLSQEFRIASPQYDRFDYVAGVYYLDQEITGAGQASALLAALDPRLPAVIGSVRHEETINSETFALFAHGNYDLTEQLQLTAGIRYTDESKDIDYVISDESFLFTNGELQDSRSASNWSPTVSLNWFPTDDTMVYGRFARAFKSGGWNADFIANIDALPFDDEEVDAFELGFKTSAFDDTLRLNGALFNQKHSDFQVFSFVQLANGGTQLTVTNAGEVTTQGFEVEAEWLASDELTVFATWGYTDATFDSFKDGGGPGVDFDGNRTTEAPENSISIGGDYRRSIWDGELVVQGDASYRDEYFSNPNNLPTNLNESQTLVNGRIGYEDGAGRWGVYLWGKNLTDEDSQVYNTRSFLGIERALYADPQTYGISFNWNFASAAD